MILMTTFLVALSTFVSKIKTEPSSFVHTPEEIDDALRIINGPIVHQQPKNNEFTSHLIFIVLTRVGAFKKRNLYRTAFLQGMEYESVDNVYHDYFFVTGLQNMNHINSSLETDPSDKTVARLFDQELKSSNDIIQGGFMDSESNNTLKVITALNWLRGVASYHNWLHLDRYVIFIEDEVTFNLLSLHRMVNAMDFYSSLTIFCRVTHNRTVDRDPTSSEFVPENIYSPSVYPPFCGDGVIVMTFDLVEEILSSVTHNLISPIVEDAGLFLTGIAAHHTSAHVSNSSWFLQKYFNCSDTDWYSVIATNGCLSDPDQDSGLESTNHTLKSIQDSLDLIAFFQGFHSKKLSALISSAMKDQSKKTKTRPNIESEDKTPVGGQSQTFDSINRSDLTNLQWIHFLWLTVIVMVLFLLFMEKRENYRLVRLTHCMKNKIFVTITYGNSN